MIWQMVYRTNIVIRMCRFEHQENTNIIIGKTILQILFWSIVYSQAIVYKHQNFFKVDVHVIIIDQCIQTAREKKSR